MEIFNISKHTMCCKRKCVCKCGERKWLNIEKLQRSLCNSMLNTLLKCIFESFNQNISNLER